ncbi:MAG: Asp-tRNA(Asn)/Glu-tRNA(Gln) amidotransferase subunit GatC [Candidatus Moranbacteria bacterium]|jgi:aspartyl-tRNA(Asn)/glutamyl-tRNA(Gln) amidotransferase subunit C|nr:Asp-tRNA(Asn)/Glu-tRNA(Gln) amidotransferase subunit GatC [Candidatus Moranbacteria bacterium]
MLSKEEIKSIASLARIGLKEEDIERYQKDISGILDYFKKMEELDTDKVEPIGHIAGTTNVYRQDFKNESSEKELESLLKNAPEIKDGAVKVKSVL